MSIIQPDSIKAIAHSIDIPRLSDEAANTLAPDVEYRLREVVQEALKFAKHAKRTKLTAEDINNALKLRNVEPVYGFNSKDPAKFLRVAPNSELMYVQDPEVSFNQLIETSLPKLPRIPGVTAHWLAINGVQPDVPQNVSVGAPPQKRRQLLGPPGPGSSRMSSLHEAAAAAAAAAVAGLDPMGHAGHAAAADSAAAAAGQQQHQQLALAAGLGGVGASPRTVATAAVQLQLPLRHAVSRELQVYFDRVVGLILAPAPAGSALSAFAPAPAAAAAAAAAGGGPAAAAAAGGGGSGVPAAAAAASGGPAAAAAAAAAAASSAPAAGPLVDKQAAMLQGALSSVASDPGLHSLVPYLCAFIADGVKQHLGSLVVVHRLLLLTRALLVNPGVHLEPYLQQLLPAVVTCVVTKALGSHPADDHWAVRREAAALLSSIARQFAAPHHNLQPRLCKVLAQALLDADKPLTSKYGAIVGLQALGPQVVRTLLIPHLEPFMSAVLIPAMAATAEPDKPAGSARAAPQQLQQFEKHLRLLLQKQQQTEAWRVYDALVSAVGSAMYDLLIGQLRGQLPVQLVLPRAGGAVGSSRSWQADYTQTLLAAKRQAAQRKQQHGRDIAAGAVGVAGLQQDAQGMEGIQGAAADAAFARLQAQQQQQIAGVSGRRGPPGLVRGQGPRTAAAAAATSSSRSHDEPSVAEVLGRSWKEDSDVNETLGALLGLFGEDLLPCLPLPELATVTL